MDVLEHTNPSTIYLDYHYWLPERGASGNMIGGDWPKKIISGLFDSCNPTPGGEPSLGSPLTKNKSTFSDYHDSVNDNVSRIVILGSINVERSEVGIFRCQALHYDWGFGPDVSDKLCSRLS